MPWQTFGNATYTKDKVGIGTDKPSIHLDVVGGGDADQKQGVVRIRSESGGEAPAIQFVPGEGSAWNIYGGLGQGVFSVMDTATGTQRFGIDPTQNACWLQNERGKPVILSFYVPYYGEFPAEEKWTSWSISADHFRMNFSNEGVILMSLTSVGIDINKFCSINTDCRVSGTLSVGGIYNVAEQFANLEERIKQLEAKMAALG